MRRNNMMAAMIFGMMIMATGSMAQVAWQTDCVTKEVALSEKTGTSPNFRAAEVEAGQRIKFRCRFHIETVDGKKAVNAGAIVDNTHSRPMHYSYSVAFMDGEGKLVAAFSKRSGGTGIPGNGSETLTDCRVFAPGSELVKSNWRRVRVYESELALGEP